ncbi:MAG TPA: filamin/ABP280 repeat domain-containing protein [Gemmatimonadales bacterium]
MSLRPPLTFVLGLSLGVAACGGNDLILPKDGEPAHITFVSVANPSQVVGQTLAESLVVEVTDPGGRPVSNVEVLFVPPAGAGVAPSDRVTTGGDGRASVSYVLSTVAGEQVVEARAPIEPATNAVATIRIQAQPDIPQGLVEDGGDEQQAQVSTALPLPLAVKAVDQFGNGVPGIEVTWEVDGGGSVEPASGITGADGRAVTTRLLGDRPGSYGTTAVAQALDGAAVPFTATAMAAPRPELVLTVQPSAQAAAGVPLQQQPQIQLQDPLGAPLAQEGVSITVQVAEGDGSLGGRTTATSDASGRVAFTDLELRGEIGTRTLIFAAEGFTPVTSSPITVQAGPPSPGQSSVSVPNGTAGESTSITIRIRDEFGNNVAGAADNLSVSITGANPASNLPVTDEGNGSYAVSYVPVHSGTDEVTVRFGEQVLGGGPQPSNVQPGAPDPATTTAQVARTGVFFVRIDVLITVRDSQGNQVGHGGDEILISANGSAPRSCAPPDGNENTCVDNGDGTYADAFVIIAGDVTVNITLNGAPISGSPFTP